MNKNNILSYFIKDIKDPIEIALYKQIIYNDHINICYKNYILCRIYKNYILNYISNIYKSNITEIIKCNYKIRVYKNSKQLFYKHDKRITTFNCNFISVSYIYKKYQVIQYFEYTINYRSVFITYKKYFNGYKYIITQYKKNKYTTNIILILNKYELSYYNKFFYFYFGLLVGVINKGFISWIIKFNI